jgi:Domain of unknown function (DUF4440)
MIKRILIWGLLGAVLFLSAGRLPGQNSDATAKAVEGLEYQWLKSQQTGNTDLLEPLLADSFIGTSEDGKISSKTEEIATEKASKYVNFEYVDLKVHVYGNAAVATGGGKGKVTDPSGKTQDVNNRWTDTWVKMPSGKWQCVASQVSNVKM